MKIDFIAPKCKLLNIERKSSSDGSINWTEVIILQGSNSNTVTCDSKLADTLKVGGVYDFIIRSDEQPKAYKNGNGAYIENKFKVMNIYSQS